jgi:hypothetical protein
MPRKRSFTPPWLNMSDHQPVKVRADPFKDSLWRFLGYANEVGEALRPLVPSAFVWSTYAIAIGYAAGDTYHKTNQVYEVRNDMRNDFVIGMIEANS